MENTATSGGVRRGLVPRGGGLFLFYKGKAVFGVKSISPSTDGEGGVLVGLTGIGGKVEPGETFREAAVRECLEEVGVEPAILTFDEPAVGRTVEPDGSLFVVFLEPIPGFDQTPEVHVFGATLAEPPKPIEKLRHILLIPPDQLPAIDSSHPTLHEAMALGTEIISADLGACPFDGKLTFIDSPGVYVPALGQRLAEYASTILSRPALR